MNLNLKLKKLERLVNAHSSDKIIMKCGIPVYYINDTDSDGEKESKKQQCINDFINKISKNLNISIDRAKQEYNKNEIKLYCVKFV